MRALRLVFSIAAAVGIVASVAAGPAAASTNCGVAGAEHIASQGRLVLIEATRTSSIVGTYRDVEACIGSRRPVQVDVLSSVDATCRVREARLAAERYVGLDIRCRNASVGFVADQVYSFDVARARVLRGSQEAGFEDLRLGFVLATNGGIAYIRDTAQGTIVFACDGHAKCNSESGTPSRHLDRLRSARGLGSLRVSGTTVSWRHGTRRRSARLF
jgi:hypothetical protein